MKKKKTIIYLISFIFLIMLLGGFKLYKISEDFSALNGLKAMANLFREDVVEVISNENETILMIRNNEAGVESLYLDLEERGYIVMDQMGAALLCIKDGKSTPIIFEMYTSYYRIYFLENN